MLPVGQYALLDLGGGSPWRVMRAAGTIGQARQTCALKSLQPLVTGLSAHLKPAAQFRKTDAALLSQGHELCSQIHGIHLLPGHCSLLFDEHCLPN
jgi:hypothetical protein